MSACRPHSHYSQVFIPTESGWVNKLALRRRKYLHFQRSAFPPCPDNHIGFRVEPVDRCVGARVMGPQDVSVFLHLAQYIYKHCPAVFRIADIGRNPSSLHQGNIPTSILTASINSPTPANNAYPFCLPRGASPFLSLTLPGSAHICSASCHRTPQ